MNSETVKTTGSQLMGVLHCAPNMSVNCIESQLEKFIQFEVGMIDVGSESTEIPVYYKLSVEEEWARIKGVIQFIAKRYPQLKISVETCRPDVAKRALDSGVHIINDISGGTEEMIKLVASRDCQYILTHHCGIPPSPDNVMPTTRDPISQVVDAFKEKFETFQTYGLDKERIIVSPGIGLGKTPEQSLYLIRNFDQLRAFLGVKVILGPSRKHFLKYFQSMSPIKREDVTLAIVAYLAERKCDIIRIHQVGPAKNIVRVTQLIAGI